MRSYFHFDSHGFELTDQFFVQFMHLVNFLFCCYNLLVFGTLVRYELFSQLLLRFLLPLAAAAGCSARARSARASSLPVLICRVERTWGRSRGFERGRRRAERAKVSMTLHLALERTLWR